MDPVKVTRSAVANAASIASLLLTTESLMVEKPKGRSPPATATGTATSTAPASKRRTAQNRADRGPGSCGAFGVPEAMTVRILTEARTCDLSPGKAYRSMTACGREFAADRHAGDSPHGEGGETGRAWPGSRRRQWRWGSANWSHSSCRAGRPRWSRSAVWSSTTFPNPARSRRSGCSVPTTSLPCRSGRGHPGRDRRRDRGGCRAKAVDRLAGIGLFGRSASPPR